MSPAAAEALHASSTPAHHGQREKTLLDTRVRDTGEIGGDALTLHWADGIRPALETEVAQALGLDRLEARLHNLLVYGPGQFFKPHQDTEKHPGMVGTLVLVWPSAHIGGDLRLQHGEQEVRFASQHLQASTLRWFAFYADCRHEVLPVAEGWRIVLTFDLLLPAQAAMPRPAVPPPLLAALRAQFDPGSGAPLKPWVLLLDHQYTERGLRWRALKGEDRTRVAVLRTAAETLGLTVHLTLARIHESWTATTGHRGRRGDDGAPEPDELIDDDIVLDFWVDADDRPLRRDGLPVAKSDVDSFTDTDASFLVDQEYEGYMGNYGETLDYWYRRAALVIQTPLAAEANRFVTDFDAALADALSLARGGRGDELAQRLHASTVALDTQRSARGREMFAACAELAAALPDATHARTLCNGFEWTDFKPDDAPELARLATRWGETWLRALVVEWATRAKSWFGREWQPQAHQAAPPWPQPLGAFIAAGRGAGLPATVIDEMLAQGVAALRVVDGALASSTPALRQATFDMRLQAVCDFAAVLPVAVHALQPMQALLRHLHAHPGLYPLSRLRPLLQALPSALAAQPEVHALHAAVVQTLERLLALPEPQADDHSLEDIEWTCRCADCRLVIDWATSSNARPLTLAIAETRRRHVQSRLQDAAAPLAVDTLKQGSPHKLVISKPSDLDTRRRRLRAARLVDLAALRTNAETRGEPGH